jgi:serine protease Do
MRGKRSAGSSLRVGTLLLTALWLAGCASYENRALVPSISLSPDNVILATNTGAAQASGVNLGMTGSINESDSLTNISILPGIRVRAVTPGGPADNAGIRAGDVILSIDGEQSNHPDLLDALAVHTTTERSFDMEVRRNTTVFRANVIVRPVTTEQAAPVELYRADPLLLRAGFTTELLSTPDQQRVSGARIVRLFDQSPLSAAGLRNDDILLALDEHRIETAQGLVTLVNNQYAPGDQLTLSYSRDSQVFYQRIRLWHPGRRLSRLSLWPLFTYESTLNPDQSSVKVGDLILFSLFSYQRRGAEQEYSVLGLFRTASGYGELLED